MNNRLLLYQFDIVSRLMNNASIAIERAEDQKLWKYINDISIVENIMKALRDIPNTRWKRFKYHINKLLRRIK